MAQFFGKVYQKDIYQVILHMRLYLRTLLVGIAASLFITGCNKTVTYAEQKERERESINSFIADNDIDVITLEEFLKDTVTDNRETGPDFSRNEYVLFPESGVYLQIVRRGTGTALQKGENKVYNCRFVEYDIANRDTVLLNLFGTNPDEMTCKRNGDTYSATFTKGYMQTYGTSVPAGWLVAMPFIKPSFYNGEPSAKIRMIVPHDKGTSTAMQSVYACYYEIILMTKKWQ